VARGDDAPAGALALESGRRILAAQPFSVLLGAELEAVEEGTATLSLPLREALTQHMGFAHGGVVSYLADNALTYAGALALGTAVLTSEMKINYVRPATGVRLVARARAEAAGRRQCVCRCDVVVVQADGTEKVCALAQGTIVVVEPATAPASAPAA